jgi:acyl-CoA synthetase (AMP-forming)/AMP-acid ligase II
MNNLASLILDAAHANPTASFGTAEHTEPLSVAVDRAGCLARHISGLGYRPGARWALVGRSSADYMGTWLAAQLAGIELALLNPDYPDEFLVAMLDDLRPDTVAWLDRPAADYPADKVELRAWWDQHRQGMPEPPSVRGEDLPGVSRSLTDISSFIHTSGTTGRPKFCALSHDYFLRLGRFCADSMVLGKHDRVFAPLPMFHINPLGYGLVGALTAKASVLGTNKFSASKFWPLVKEHDFTALVLHSAPSVILATSTTGADAQGHTVRVAFGVESMLCELFDIPVGVGGFGSTEAGGLCHSWHFRAGDAPMATEGSTNFTGRPRYDIAFSVDANDEILVRNNAGTAILSGYIRNGEVCDARDNDGWFHTGDRGRIDDAGCLVFIERMNEAIRVKGEYVPIDYVEGTLTQCASLGAFALWRRPSKITGQVAVIYTEATNVNLDDLRNVMKTLPKFMQAQQLVHIKELPKTGIGKIQRARLDDLEVLDTQDIWRT